MTDLRAVIRSSVIHDICRWAMRGYESYHKAERLGYLLGTLPSDGAVRVDLAVLFRSGVRSRTRAEFRQDLAHRRRLELESRHGIEYLGMFHSHVEIAGKLGLGLSSDDTFGFREDTDAVIETVCAVRAAGRRPTPTSRRAVAAYDETTGYAYNLRVYAKTNRGVRLVENQVLAT